MGKKPTLFFPLRPFGNGFSYSDSEQPLVGFAKRGSMALEQSSLFAKPSRGLCKKAYEVLRE
jgi:hypothetical protein